MNPVLLPFAAVASALLAWFALAPLAPAGVDFGAALSAGLDQPWAAGLGLGMALGLPPGFFWQGVFWPRSAAARMGAAIGVLLGLSMLAWALHVGRMFFLPMYASPGGALGQCLGFGLGALLWRLAGPALLEYPRRLRGPWWPALVTFAALMALLPLEPGSPVGATGLSDAWPGDVPQRVYGLIKAAMPWVPLGFLLVLAGRGESVPRLGVALAVGLVLMGWPYLGDMPWRDVLEWVFALPGLWLGAWLGAGTRGAWTVESEPAARVAMHVRASSLPTPGLPARGEGGSEGAARGDALPARRVSGASGKRRERGREPADAAPGGPSAFDMAGPAGLLSGLAVLVLAMAGLWDFPRWPVLLGLGLTLYVGLLWWRPLAWLVVVPAALPLLDLAPWTGRFFFDEFDLVMLVTAGMLLLRGEPARPQPLLPGAGMLTALFGISVLVSLFAGLLPMPAMDANAFSSYWSPYNSLRIAKGMAWGGLIFLWVRRSGLAMDVLGRRMAVGMGVGLLGVSLVGVWEHWLFAGQANGTYRIFSTFSSMHTGGGHIEAYLAAAVPFLWLYMGRWRDLALSGPLLLLTALAMLYTVARGGLVALGVVVVILAVGSIRLAGARRAIMPVALMLSVVVVLGIGAGGGYLQQRLAQTGQDWQIRVDHWAQALGLRGDAVTTGLFGMGLGSFPRAYLQRGPIDKQSGTYAFAREGDNTYLRLGAGETLYFAQRVDVKGGQGYRLEFDARADGAAARIETPVCEKQMLNSRQCVWLSFDVPGDGQWHHLSRSFSSADVGREPAWRRPPVEMFLYMPVKGRVMAVDNLHLIGPDGRDLLCNGDFSRGGDCWFFKTLSHLPWHIKNLWVHVLFEQGWVGLLLFGSLTVLAIYRLARAGWRGHRVAWVWLASLAGLLTVGMFDSLLDAPRLATLLVALTLLGVGFEWERGALPSRSGHARKRRRQRSREDSGSGA